MASAFPDYNFEEIRNYLWSKGKGNILLSKDESSGIATLTIDNVEKRNAITGHMMVQLRDCILEMETWEEGKAVLLHSKGENFCSGGDLELARTEEPQKVAEYTSIWMQDSLNRLQQLPFLSVCLLQGPSIGGGAELSAACDYIVVSENVQFGFVHAKMGIITAWGGGTRLVNKIGQRKALDLLLTAKVLTASECLNIGLADTVVPTSESFAKTVEWLSPKIQHHASIVRAYKTIAANTRAHSRRDCLTAERSIFIPFWGGPLNREALSKNIKHKLSK